jgi:predicted glycosyltransferase
MAVHRNLRVAIYSHDTFGLGHLTRSTRIAQGVVAALPDASVLILSGSPVAHRFSFPAGVDYIKLPSVVKSGPEKYESRELGLSPSKIRRMRARLIRETLAQLRPHLFLVDNVPHGMKGELLPALELLRQKRMGTRIHLNLRDILDDPETVQRTWRESGVYESLDGIFDAIHVFGTANVFAAIAAYDLPREKSAYLGYIGSPPQAGLPPATLPHQSAEGHRILVTTGGGGDGEETIRCVAELQKRLGEASPFIFHIVTGPLMKPRMRRAVLEEIVRLPRVTVHEYVECLPAWMARCDLVLSMGGYNTLCEVMQVAHRSVVVPRVYPRREQEIRARALESHGLLRVLPSRDLSADRLEEALVDSLDAEPVLTVRRPQLRGISRLGSILRRLFSSPVPKVAANPTQDGVARSPESGHGLPSDNARRGSSGRRAAARVSLRAQHPPPLLWLLMGIIGSALLAGVTPRAMAGVHVSRLAVTMLSGYDSNLLDASNAEREAFDESSPKALFVVDRMADLFLEGSAEADWELGRPLGVKSKLRIRGWRRQYAHSPIKNESNWSTGLHLKPGGGVRTVLEVEYRPQVYGRHRLDKDALPGAAQYRAEVHRRWDAALAVEGRLGDGLQLAAELAASAKDYSQPFNERDRRRIGLSGELVHQVSPRIEVGCALGWCVASSRNEPDLGKDLSYREWTAEPWVRLGQIATALDLEAGLELDWRHYTSRDRDDWNHWKRKDLLGEGYLRLALQLSSSLIWQTDFVTRWRRADLATGQSIDYDEEGSFSERTVRGGITWYRER